MVFKDGLQILVSKEPVVATHVGIFDNDSAQNTYHRYRSETETFVVAPDILRYQRQFVQTVIEQQTTVACLVAPFGYGKTSTAISIWNACEEAGLLAIPPFSCNSIAEMGQAIVTAILHKLEGTGNIANAERVRDAFDKYLTSSAKRLAEQDAERYGISVEVALKSIEDKIKSGHLQLDASATHLLSFLEELVTIAKESGFQGLVVIVDEFQQFLGNINKGVITNFRTLIWGLQTRGELPLGFLITMDPDTERNLTDRGADILHRIRNHGLYMAFSSIYDREFPRELWSRYAEAFDFTKDSAGIVDHPTLEAIGQICERPDLSNGPRTVINVFQRIAELHLSREQPYSPIDLINDFLTGDIRFDGDRGKIASLVNEITSYDYIKRSQERVETIKLIAAFPRGCPPEVANKYGIRSAYDYLFDELRGEIFVELPEGVALVDLQKVGKPPNKLNIILKKYWLQITEEEIISDKALQYFSEYGVSPLFPDYVSHQNGWKPEIDRFLLTSSGGYFRVYEGTFFEEYPRRRVAVQVCFELEHIVEPDGFVDAQFIFLIQRNSAEEEVQQLEDNTAGIPTFVVPILIHSQYSRRLPRDIREIESFLSPVVLTPGVLVSLLNYIVEQVPKIEGMSEQEHQRIMDTHGKLQEFLLTMSISDQTFEPYGITIYSRGVQAFRDALFNILRHRFPNYETTMSGSSWKRLLDQYKEALEAISSSQRRGIEPLSDQKQALASLFGQRQYAGFESYAKQYNGLVEVDDWRADSGAIVFHRHPQENALIEVISAESGIKRQDLFEHSRHQGYLYEETEYLVEFLLLRGYIEYVEKDDCFVLASTFTQDELTNIAHDVLNELEIAADYIDAEEYKALTEQIEQLLIFIGDGSVDLSDAQVRLLQCQRQGQALCKQAVVELRARVQQRIEELYRYRAQLDTPLPESATGTFLDAHINGAQRTLSKDTASLSTRIQKRAVSMREMVEISIDLENGDFATFENFISRVNSQLELLSQEEIKIQSLLAQRSTHHQWVQLVDRLQRLRDMTEAAATITDTELIEKTIDRLQWDIQQELASEGLKHYRAIYDRFVGPVNDIQRELETLSRLAHSQSQNGIEHSEEQLQIANQRSNVTDEHQRGPEPHGDVHSIEHEYVNLRVMFADSAVQANEFLQHLIELNEMGELLVYRKKKNL